MFFSQYLNSQRIFKEKQRLLSDCAYERANLRLCWSHIPHSWKSHVTAHMYFQVNHITLSRATFQGHNEILNLLPLLKVLLNLLYASVDFWRLLITLSNGPGPTKSCKFKSIYIEVENFGIRNLNILHNFIYTL